MLIFSFLFSFKLLASVYIPPSQTLEDGKWQLAMNNDLSLTEGNYDENGNNTKLLGDNSFSSFQSEYILSYGLTDEFQISAGFRVRSNQAEVDLGASSVIIKEYGVESWYFHSLYTFWKWNNTYLSVEASYRGVIYNNPEFNAGTPNAFIVLGDAENEMYFGGIINYYEPLYKNSISFKFGYRNPGDSLAGEMLYDLEGALDYKKIALVANLSGVMSMNDDPLAVRTPIDNSPSALYNSSNREWVRMGGGINFKLGKDWRVDARAYQTLQGNFTDDLQIYALNLVYRPNEQTVSHKINQEFKEYAVEGEVTKVSPTELFVVANIGSSDGVHKAMRFDLYHVDINGRNTLVARGSAYEVKSRMTIIKIIKIFSDSVKLKTGLIARGGLSEH